MAMPLPQPESAAHRVTSRLKVSQEELAHILGVSARTLSRWLRTSDPKLEEKLSDLDTIIEEAEQTLRPEAVPRWFRLPLEPLGGLRPLDLLASNAGKQRVRSLLAEIRWGTLG